MMNHLNMRLPYDTVKAIQRTFKKLYSQQDALYLFGSRVHLDKKGGDIDLFIKPGDGDAKRAEKLRPDFIFALWQVIGEQKIDVVIYDKNVNLLVYELAQKEGVCLVMPENEYTVQLLEVYLSTMERHEEVLTHSLNKAKRININQAEISLDEVETLEAVAMRFIKVQDLIGAKIFKELLKLMQDKVYDSMIDRLNVLEKLELIPHAGLWNQWRETRNLLTHEYPNSPDIALDKLPQIITEVEAFMLYWHFFKGRAQEEIKKYHQLFS